MKRYLLIAAAVMAVCVILTGCGENRIESGLELLETGDYDEAAAKFEEAVENGQDPGEAYRGIGIARWEQGEYAAARDAFVSALECETEETATIYHLLGSCELQLGNPRGALAYFDLGLACEDCSEQAKQEMMFNKIAAYEECGEWEEARALLEKYAEAYPDDERAEKEAEFLETQ